MKRLLSCFVLLSVLLMPLMVPAEEEDVSLFAKPTATPTVDSVQPEAEEQETNPSNPEEPVILQPDGSVMITISAGGVQFSKDDNVSQQELIESADRGLYLSKKNGRNRVTIITHDESHS